MSVWESFNWNLLLQVANAVGLVVLWLRKPGEDAGQKAEAVGSRVNLLEERLKHMPTSDELTELEGTVKEVKATLEAMKEQQELARRTLARIEDYLLNNARR